jgi:hypothetical protein
MMMRGPCGGQRRVGWLPCVNLEGVQSRGSGHEGGQWAIESSAW